MRKPPPIPRWLFDAADQIGNDYGVPRHLKLWGLVAAAYMAGWEDRDNAGKRKKKESPDDRPF